MSISKKILLSVLFIIPFAQAKTPSVYEPVVSIISQAADSEESHKKNSNGFYIGDGKFVTTFQVFYNKSISSLNEIIIFPFKVDSSKNNTEAKDIDSKDIVETKDSINSQEDTVSSKKVQKTQFAVQKILYLDAVNNLAIVQVNPADTALLEKSMHPLKLSSEDNLINNDTSVKQVKAIKDKNVIDNPFDEDLKSEFLKVKLDSKFDIVGQKIKFISHPILPRMMGAPIVVDNNVIGIVSSSAQTVVLATLISDLKKLLNTSSVNCMSVSCVAQEMIMLKKQATRKNKNAQYALGMIYRNKFENKLTESSRWFLEAATQGHIEAQFQLGLMYKFGEGVEKDFTQAFNLFKKIADIGHIEAQYNVALMYKYGEGVDKNLKNSYKYSLKSAKKGYALAQNMVGNAHKHGDGTDQDYKEAVFWFRLAAKQNSPYAQNNMGLMHRHGKGVPKNHEEAFVSFEEAAKQGQHNSQFQLGLMYKFGEGVKANAKQAFFWFEQAAKQHNANSQYNVALLYLFGHGVEQSDTEAFLWFKEAAVQKHAKAQYYLGLMHLKGRGTTKNTEEAFSWFLKANDHRNQKHPEASYQVAVMYKYGEGVDRNLKEAFELLKVLAKNGHHKARIHLKSFKNKTCERSF